MLTKGISETKCIALICMEDTITSHIGQLLAQTMGWAYMDTNHIIEATYGLRLGELASSIDKKTFFDIKNTILSSIHVRRTVLSIESSTCSKHTLQYIHTLGPIMYIALPLSILLQYRSKTKAIQSSSDNKKNLKEHVYKKDLFYTQEATYKITYKGQPLEHIIHMIIQNLNTMNKHSNT